MKPPRIKEFPNDGRTWRVDWLGAIERNEQVYSEPLIHIHISPVKKGITKNFHYSGSIEKNEQSIIKVGVGQLPIICIGSLWLNQTLLPQKSGNSKSLSLDISTSKISIIRANKTIDGKPIIPRASHQIGTGLNSYCIAIEHDGDPYNGLAGAFERKGTVWPANKAP